MIAHRFQENDVGPNLGGKIKLKRLVCGIDI